MNQVSYSGTPNRRAAIRTRRISKLAIANITVAFVLLGANVIGLFASLRNPAIYDEPLAARRPTLTEEQIWERINSYDGRDARTYATVLTTAVHEGIAHYWDDSGIDKYHLRVPFYENYLLNLASYVFPSRYRKYEFTNYKRAIERGVGLCSQMAIIEAKVLKEKGLHSRMISLGRHVVAEGRVDDGRWWVLDPDYGVAIHHSIAEIQQNPAIVRDDYLRAGVDEKAVDLLVDIYTHDPITVFPGDGTKAYHPKKRFVERLSCVMIWVIPVGMLAFGYGAFRRGRRRELHPV